MTWTICLRRAAALGLPVPPTRTEILGRRVAVLYPRRRIVCVSALLRTGLCKSQKDPLVRNVSRSQKMRMRLGAPDLFGPMPERPRGMWRRTYERHCAVLAHIEGNLFA